MDMGVPARRQGLVNRKKPAAMPLGGHGQLKMLKEKREVSMRMQIQTDAQKVTHRKNVLVHSSQFKIGV